MTRCMIRLAAALLVTCSAAVTMAAPAPEQTLQSYDSYRSWLVACDNTLSCVVKGFSDQAPGTEIRIERQAGADGTLLASIRVDHPFTLADITIDGTAADLQTADQQGAWEIATADGETSATSDDLVAIRGLVQCLRNASEITIGGSSIPLDGFTAAMLRLDARQGRVDGVTALLRQGPKPASDVPPLGSLPRIAIKPIKATLAAGEDSRLIAKVRASPTSELQNEDCDVDLAEPKPEAHALDRRLALVLVPCLQGAYQSSSLAFIVPRDDGKPRRLVPPTPYMGNDPDLPDATLLSEVSFDPTTATLSMAAKGRAMADCGVSASWIWDGREFRLSNLAVQNSCGGVEPGDWPTLFRSTQ